MQKELKERWIAALRSGEYKQGRNYLNKDGGLCCLGVLCEVMELPKYEEDYEGGTITIYSDAARALPPSEVMDKQGLYQYWATLASMNDNIDNQAPFTEIADWIEENIPSE